MKQLLHFDSTNSTLVFGLGHRAFLYSEKETLTELDLSEEENNNTQGEQEDEEAFKEDKTNEERSIQAIAYDGSSQTTAVALRNKKLLLIQQTEHDPNQHHVTKNKRTIILTEKRITKLRFTKLDETTTILLATDMIGDLTAYRVMDVDPMIASTHTNTAPELPKTILLGHTASVLTDMQMITTKSSSRYILTADRDEKIRVSQFPQAHEIHGYLLSHRAFVSSVCVMDSDRVASVAGDGRIIVWDIETLKEEASCDIDSRSDVVPTKILCLHPRLLGILCDKDCQLYIVEYDETTATLQPTLDSTKTFSFPSVPLDMCHCGAATDDAARIAVLFREPPFLRYYTVSSEAVTEVTPPQLTKSLSHLPTTIATIPTSLLEHSCIAKHGIDQHVKRANHMDRLPKQKDRIRDKRQRRKK